MPCWRIAHSVNKNYKGVNWIHPLKQRSVELLLEEIKRHDSIKYAVIFGSSVEERCTPYSDVDVLLSGAKNIRFICPDVDDFDIVYAEEIPKTDIFWEEIRRDGVCIYEKNADGAGMG